MPLDKNEGVVKRPLFTAMPGAPDAGPASGGVTFPPGSESPFNPPNSRSTPNSGYSL